MEMKQLDSMPGMPSGVPFALVLAGIVLAILGPIFHSINERFFLSTGMGFQTLGLHLVEWGAVLQGVSWVCAAFGRRTTPPPM